MFGSQIKTVGIVVMMMALWAAMLPRAYAEDRVRIGDKISLDLKTSEGQAFTSQDLEGRLVILEFWATWCGPCRGQLPHLKKLHEQYKPKGVVLISVSTDDDKATWQQFIKDNQMTWVQVRDGDQSRSVEFAFFSGRYGIPHAFIISPQGMLLWSGSPRDIDEPLEQAMQKHPPRTKRAARSADEFSAAIKAANTAIDGKDMAALVDAVAGFPDSAFEDKAVAARMKSLARRINSPAVDQAKLTEALVGKTDVIAMFDQLKAISPAIPESAGANESNATRVSPEIVKLRMEKADAARGKNEHVEAYRLYKWIADKAAGSDDQLVAQEHVTAYEANEAFMAQLKKAEDTEAARAMLATARSYVEADKKDLAIETCQNIANTYPNTPEAKQAKEMLTRLKR